MKNIQNKKNKKKNQQWVGVQHWNMMRIRKNQKK